MKFKTHYNLGEFPKVFTPLSDKRLVETAGYISAKQRIENIINAGEKLHAWRAENYDFTGEEPIDEDFCDPTRSKNFDLADVTQIEQRLEAKARSKKASKTLETNENSTEGTKSVPMVETKEPAPK